MDLDAAFGLLFGSFPSIARFQGIQFKYSSKNNGLLIETRKFDNERNCPVHFYWLLVNGQFMLVHTSTLSKLHQAQTIDETTFSPREYALQ